MKAGIRKEQTVTVSIRLSKRHLAALDKYIEAKETAVRAELPEFSLSQSGAIRVIVESHLNKAGYVENEQPIFDEQQPIFDHATTLKMIEADLISGNYETQRELAKRFNKDPAVISRIKRDLKESGRLK